LSATRPSAEVVAALAGIELFRNLHDDELDRLAALCAEESHGPEHVIFEQGDAGDRLYLILEGRVRISRQVPGMGEEALALLGPGAAFGEMALVDEAPRSADARVHERCRLLVIAKAGLADLMLLDKALGYEILCNFVRILASRLRETNDKMTFLSVTSRF
jgi:CRP-like cAMP-binding protein